MAGNYKCGNDSSHFIKYGEICCSDMRLFDPQEELLSWI